MPASSFPKSFSRQELQTPSSFSASRVSQEFNIGNAHIHKFTRKHLVNACLAFSGNESFNRRIFVGVVDPSDKMDLGLIARRAPAHPRPLSAAGLASRDAGLGPDRISAAAARPRAAALARTCRPAAVIFRAECAGGPREPYAPPELKVLLGSKSKK
jgi:hypothetical protein